MKNHLDKLVSGKKVLILGFGREGRSTLNILQKVNSYSELAVSDINAFDTSEYGGITFYSRDKYLDILDDYDIVFKSPGIVLPREIFEYKCRITSQMEQFLYRYREQVIGITGTKGKSTTSSMLYHVLSNNGVNSIFGGNIGIPVFDLAGGIDERTVIVLEMSCHQLEYLEVSPAISVFLNLYEDHLDHYGSFEKYCYVKQNIYRYQRAEDHLFCNPSFLPADNDSAASMHYVSADILPERAKKETRLKGEHNYFNIAVVYSICGFLGLDEEGVLDALATFSPLSHRLEFIGNVDGVDYYDDSISTTAESSISAVTSIKNAGSLLVGGMDRGIDYSGLIEFLADCKLKYVIFMYESGKRIFDKMKDMEKSPDTEYVYLPDLKSAVEFAKDNTPKGMACILSPAAASYGEFKNFEERGKEFNRLVHL